MAFDPNEARGYHGRWTAGAGGEIPVAPDPRVATIAGGDIWNKDTAARLENEYAAARPALNKIANGASEYEGEVAAPAASGWDSLTGSGQDKAEQDYKDTNFNSELENEVSNWHESGDAQATAAQDLQHDEDWKADTLADYKAAREEAGLPEIPYDDADLLNAIHLTSASPDEYQNGTNVDPLVQFSASDLQKPTDLNPDAHNPDQLAMPGITPNLVALEDHLTQDVRADLSKYFIEEFNSTVEKKAEDVTAPDYLSDNVQETLNDSWAQMSDEEKYDWTKHNTSIADDLDEEKTTDPGSLELPQKWDPLNETSGADYTKTQALAKYMADTRAVQIMAERGVAGADRRRSWGAYNTEDLTKNMNRMADKLAEAPPNLSAEYKTKYAADIQNIKEELAFRKENGNLPPSIDDIREVDKTLWDGWKGSSTGGEGRLLQVAAADELGGRLREAPKTNTPTTVTVGGQIIHAPNDAAMDKLLEAKTTLANTKSSVGDMKIALKTVDNLAGQFGSKSFDIGDKWKQAQFDDAKSLILNNAWGEVPATLDGLENAKKNIAMYEKESLASDAAGFDDPYKAFAAGKAAQDGTLEEFSAAVKQAYANSSNPANFGVKISADKNMSDEQKKIAHDLLYYSNQTPPNYAEYTSAMAMKGSVTASPIEKVTAQIVVDAYKTHQEAVAHGAPTKDKTPLLKTETVQAGSFEYGQNFIRLPGLDLQRNGAASFTTDRAVANAWGGTANHATQGINRQEVINKANSDFKQIGGYEGVKAALRAKWETTQFMLDKADVPVLNLYRGITLSHRREGDPETDRSVKIYPSITMAEKMGAGQGDLVDVTKSGVPSSGETHFIKDANGSWVPYSGPPPATMPPPIRSRVVIRAEVPRTAVLSVPAYGQNVHSEHEVVITGTAWHNWDAYSDRAPSHEEVPIGKSNVIEGPGPTTDLDKLITKLAPQHLDVGPEPAWEAQDPNAGLKPLSQVTIKLTPDQEAYLAKHHQKVL